MIEFGFGEYKARWETSLYIQIYLDMVQVPWHVQKLVEECVRHLDIKADNRIVMDYCLDVANGT